MSLPKKMGQQRKSTRLKLLRGEVGKSSCDLWVNPAYHQSGVFLSFQDFNSCNSLIDNELRHTGFKSKIKAGIVLTGGGSLLRGCTEMAEEVFGMPTRMGVPLELGDGLSKEIESPEFATVAGLIRGTPSSTEEEGFNFIKDRKIKSPIKLGGIFKKVQEFFDEL